MANTFTYRQKKYSVDQLRGIARKKGTNLNRLIEFALIEKIHQDEIGKRGGDVDALTEDLKRVVVEHMGVKLLKPNQRTHERILKKMRETNPKDMISDRLVRPHRYK